ncbi:MAG: ribosome-binding factor A [Firmicutes bacterium]|jgi:ribosome-binding factor A|nr:ribosome-binding factor A [Bacillota bacterium]
MARSQKQHSFPRTERLSSLFAKILAAEIERIADLDERLFLLTLTGVVVYPDLKHATIFFDAPDSFDFVVLEDYRGRLKTSIASLSRLKRVPELHFMADPAITSGKNIDNAIRNGLFHREVVVDEENYKDLDF